MTKNFRNEQLSNILVSRRDSITEDPADKLAVHRNFLNAQHSLQAGKLITEVYDIGFAKIGFSGIPMPSLNTAIFKDPQAALSDLDKIQDAFSYRNRETAIYVDQM